MCAVDLNFEALPFGRLWYGEPNAVANAIGYAEHYSRSHDAVIRVYDAAGNVIGTHEHKGEFNEWSSGSPSPMDNRNRDVVNVAPLKLPEKVLRIYSPLVARS